MLTKVQRRWEEWVFTLVGTTILEILLAFLRHLHSRENFSKYGISARQIVLGDLFVLKSGDN